MTAQVDKGGMMDVSLRPDLERFVREEVRSGHYGSESEALNAAAELLRERELLNGDELGRLISVGQAQIDRGEVIEINGEEDLHTFFDGVKTRGRERQNKKPPAP